MKVYYIDDSSEFEDLLRNVVTTLNQSSSTKLEYQFVTNDGEEDDFIFFDHIGQSVWNSLDRIPLDKNVHPRMLLKKSTVDSFIEDSENALFLIDISFSRGDDPGCVEIAEYGLNLSKHLFENGISKERIVVITSHRESALKKHADNITWSDIISKDELTIRTTDESVNSLVYRLSGRINSLQRKLLINNEELTILEQNAKNYLESSGLALQSPNIIDVYNRTYKAAQTDCNILILGENGTGKENIASFIHAMSTRNSEIFWPLNCAAIPETLIESELFGHEKGAFTGAFKMKKGAFELASNGTLFLDEIGDLILNAQAKLLRAIQNGIIQRVGSSTFIKVNVRLVCATNQDLMEKITSGEFRDDLYYRISTFPVNVPPLRDRLKDIPKITHDIIHDYNLENSQNIQITHKAIDKLTSYNWPGNIRELQNVVLSACIDCDSHLITPEFIRPTGNPKNTQNLTQKKEIGWSQIHSSITNEVGLKRFFPSLKKVLIKSNTDQDLQDQIWDILIFTFEQSSICPESFRPFSEEETNQYRRVLLAFFDSCFKEDLSLFQELRKYLALQKPPVLIDPDYSSEIKNLGSTDPYSKDLRNHRQIVIALIKRKINNE